MQTIWTEHMRNDLDVKRASTLIASALEIDTEPGAKYPHAVENLPITEPEPFPKEPLPNAIEVAPPAHRARAPAQGAPATYRR